MTQGGGYMGSGLGMAIKNDKYHRIEYRVNDEWHRTNGPAFLWYDGDFDWYLFGEQHRYYGPVNLGENWWIHGEYVK